MAWSTFQRRSRVASLLLVALLIGSALLLAFGSAVALMLAPGALLAILLVHGVEPGEQLINRMRQRRSPALRLRAQSVSRPRLVLVVRRAGRLFESSLAMRPPPGRLLHP